MINLNNNIFNILILFVEFLDIVSSFRKLRDNGHYMLNGLSTFRKFRDNGRYINDERHIGINESQDQI